MYPFAIFCGQWCIQYDLNMTPISRDVTLGARHRWQTRHLAGCRRRMSHDGVSEGLQWRDAEGPRAMARRSWYLRTETTETRKEERRWEKMGESCQRSWYCTDMYWLYHIRLKRIVACHYQMLVIWIYIMLFDIVEWTNTKQLLEFTREPWRTPSFSGGWAESYVAVDTGLPQGFGLVWLIWVVFIDFKWFQY